MKIACKTKQYKLPNSSQMVCRLLKILFWRKHVCYISVDCNTGSTNFDGEYLHSFVFFD